MDFIGYLLYSLNFLSKNLAIPLVLAALTLVFQWRQQLANDAFQLRQQLAADALAERHSLVEAYIEFGRAHSDYRIASATISFLAHSNVEEVDEETLKKAVLELDKAFDSIGAKLTPFEEFQRHYGAVDKRGETPLQVSWENCFLQPYHGGLAGHQSHWGFIDQQLQRCESGRCKIKVVQTLQSDLAGIDTGRCDGGVPVEQHPFDRYWGELRKVMEQSHVLTLTPIQQTPS